MACVNAAVAADEAMPHLRKRGTAAQLMVDGEPFLVIGGELHNSSSSSLEYMQPVWQRMVDMNFNTVLAGIWCAMCFLARTIRRRSRRS